MDVGRLGKCKGLVRLKSLAGGGEGQGLGGVGKWAFGIEIVGI